MTPSGGYCGDGCDDSFVDPSPPKTQAFRTSPLGQDFSPVLTSAFAVVIISCLLPLFYRVLDAIRNWVQNKDEVQVVHGFDNGAREQYHLPEGAMQWKIPKDVDVDLRFRPLPNQVGVFHVQDKKSHRNVIYSGSMFLRKQGQVASNRFSSSPDPDDTPPAPLGPTDAPKWNSHRTFGIQDGNDSYGPFAENNYRSQSPSHQFGFDRRIAPGPTRYQTTTRPSVGTVPPPPKQGQGGQFGGSNQSQTRLYRNSRNDNNAQNTVPKSPFGFQSTSPKLPPSSFQNTSPKLPPSSSSNLGQLPASRAPGPRSGSNSMFGGGSQLQWQSSIYNDKKQASVSNNQRAPQIRNTWPVLPLLALKHTKPSANVIAFPIPPRDPASGDDSDWTLYAFKF